MNKPDAKGRKTYIDTARALCMLWIVGYWHMDIDHSRFMPWIEGFTIGILATFTFLSGYFLGGQIKTNREVFVFYSKRIKRFYLLFVLSCITLYMLHLIFRVNYISSTPQFIYSLLGMSCFIGVAPQTIWYMVMIMFFYLVTPLITRWKKIGIKMISACAIFVFLYLLYKLNYADVRFILYYPIYILGIFCHSLKLPEKFNIKTMLVVALFMAFSLCVYQINPEHIVVKWLSEISVTMFIVEISKLITVKSTYKFFSIISYASLCAYLFHRQFFYVVNRLFGDIPFIIMWLLVLPTFLLGSWWIQKMYDSFILKRLFVRKSKK